MARMIVVLLLITFAVPTALSQTQEFNPPPPFMPDAETMKAIGDKRTELSAAIETLRKSEKLPAVAGPDHLGRYQWDPMLEVFVKAADWIVRHNEFFQKDSGKQTLAVLDEGLRRAKDFSAFQDSLKAVGGRTFACGYRSRIDNSIQPYVVTYPLDYGKDPKRKWRLDIVLHGRDNTLTEVKMLAGALKRGNAKPDQDYVQLEVYGRGNNAYRWAGETDIFEAQAAFIDMERELGRPDVIDPERVVLRGFSMGGAGAWHIGLHYPTRWCVIGPGAGFTATHGYIKNLPAKLPDYQEACLHIYDAVDYAENAAMVPVVAYAGDKDPQQQAALNIEEIVKPLGIPMTRLVGLGLAHQFPPEWQKKAQEAYAPFVQRGRSVHSKKIHFVTYTLSYSRCDWLTLLEQDQQYARTTIDASVTPDGYNIVTKNVHAFYIDAPSLHAKQPIPVLNIDGQSVPIERTAFGRIEDTQSNSSAQIAFLKGKGLWKVHLKVHGTSKGVELLRELGYGFKTPGKKDWYLHGPIDDAFNRSFVCIRGTGKCTSPQVQAYTEAALARFRREWEIYFRADLPVITDKEYLAGGVLVDRRASPSSKNDDSVADRSLILFGDPSSNAVIASILEKSAQDVPLKWNAKEIAFGDQVYDAATHVPAFIYPKPSGIGNYIVINSGHTFHEADLKGTNALLYPRLGDFAILKPTPTAKDPAAAEVVRAGLFDEMWKVPSSK